MFPQLHKKLQLPRFEKNISSKENTFRGKIEESSNKPFLAVESKGSLYRQFKITFNLFLHYPQDETKFPGNLPVSLMKSDIPSLFHSSTSYGVIEKTDGTRYLLFIFLFQSQPVMLLIDRALQFWMLADCLGMDLWHGTLVDVEYCPRFDEKTQSTTHTFWIFDVLLWKGHSVMEEHYVARLARAQCLAQSLLISPYSNVEFRAKEAHPIEDLRDFVSTILPKRKKMAPTDGLIFTPMENSYVQGQDPETFKFKHGNDNTVDLRARLYHTSPSKPIVIPDHLRISSDNVLVELWVDNPSEFYVYTTVSTTQFQVLGIQSILELDQKIVQCRQTVPGKWMVESRRTDKNAANNLATVKKTEQNIEESIQLSDLFCQCPACRESEKHNTHHD